MAGAEERWRRGLEAWAIPPEILDAAPESPFGFPVAIFERAADRAPADTPSRLRAIEALGDGGTVLDVGCGAGAASLALVPPASRVVGADESTAMLEAFETRAEQRGVDSSTVPGRWPDVAGRCPVADVVVCHHVLYNVPDAAEFLTELHRHAARRVVVELTAAHPLSWMNPLWRELHGVVRPSGPVADDLLAVLSEAGITAAVERSEIDVAGEAAGHQEHLVEATRRRLCLPASRDGDVLAALQRHPMPTTRSLVTLWWDTPAGGTQR